MRASLSFSFHSFHSPVRMRMRMHGAAAAPEAKGQARGEWRRGGQLQEHLGACSCAFIHSFTRWQPVIDAPCEQFVPAVTPFCSPSLDSDAFHDIMVLSLCAPPLSLPLHQGRLLPPAVRATLLWTVVAVIAALCVWGMLAGLWALSDKMNEWEAQRKLMRRHRRRL